MTKLKDGDKYLTIKVLGNITLKAFKVDERTTDKHPHYKGEGVSVWINTYQEDFKPAPHKIVEYDI